MSRQTFWDHVEDLRRLVIKSVLALLFFSFIFFFFHNSLLHALLDPIVIGKFYFYEPFEGMMVAIKLSFWLGFVCSSPLWVFFLIQFLLPALKPKEKRLILPFIFLSGLFLFLGGFFAYKVTIPLVIGFFHDFNARLGENYWGIGQTLDFVLGIVLGHALVFELYVVLLLLVHFRIFKHSHLKKGRRGVIVGIFVLSAILTPPDVLSQLLMAFPLLIFYEGAILYAWKRKRKRKKLVLEIN